MTVRDHGALTVHLASASPRRRELLAQIGLHCIVEPAGADESRHPGEAAADYVLRLALEKARLVWQRVGGGMSQPVVAADTAVVVNGEVLGKPADAMDGRRMLGLLSGRAHEVLTAVAVISAAGESSAVSRSEVVFRALSPGEIEAYWRSGEPADKAGGYAIQGLGALFVSGLRGSYSGVMGLPLFETAQLLQAHGVTPLASAERAR